MNKYILLLTLTIALPLSVIAQKKPAYQKKTYVSPDGKLYIQKELGIYLWLSTSEDESSKKFKLQSEETTKYSNPMFLDTDGYNTLRSPSAVDPETRKTVYPIRDIIFEVYADESSPVTTIDYGDSKPFKSEGKLYVKSDTKVSLEAKDAQAGVEGIYYSIDGKEYSKYTQALSFSEEREYAVKFYSVDNVGNDEEIHEISYVYDKTPPVSKRTISVDEHENIISARSTVALSAEDKGIGVQKIVYKIDDGHEYTYQHPLRASMLSQGEHTISYYSVDKAGNSETLQSYTLYIDKSAPTIIEEVIGKSFFANGKEFSSGKSQLKLTAFDNKAGIKEIRYSINGGEYQLYTKPVFLSQTDGNLLIKSYAVDNVNNKSTSQTANDKTSIPYIDLSGPSLSYALSGPKFETRDTIFINSKTDVVLKARDLEAGLNRIEYSINGGTSTIYEKPINLTEEGVHTISYIGYDNVENTGSGSLTVKVDNTGPSINHQFSTAPTGGTTNNKTYPKYTLLFLSGTDNVVGLENIKYNFGTGETKIYSAPVSGFSEGGKTMKFIASDKLGNTTEQEITFEIKE
jgi:hypothetical protein